MRFGSRGPSEFATECLDRDCVGRRRTGNGHNVYRSVRSLRVVSLVFRGYDLLKIAKINVNPQQEVTLSVWKKLVPRESAGNGAQVLVNT